MRRKSRNIERLTSERSVPIYKARSEVIEMNPYIDPKKLKERCEDPNFCIVCFLVKDNAKVDEHHVCEDCRKGSNGMPRRLSAITLENGKTYFVDERLRQLRNVHDPHDFIDF